MVKVPHRVGTSEGLIEDDFQNVLQCQRTETEWDGAYVILI